MSEKRACLYIFTSKYRLRNIDKEYATKNDT